jgi:hypothetical protein
MDNDIQVSVISVTVSSDSLLPAFMMLISLFISSWSVVILSLVCLGQRLLNCCKFACNAGSIHDPTSEISCNVYFYFEQLLARH